MEKILTVQYSEDGNKVYLVDNQLKIFSPIIYSEEDSALALVDALTMYKKEGYTIQVK